MHNPIGIVILAAILACAGLTHAEGKRDFIHYLIMDGKEDDVRRKITKYPSLLELPYTEGSKVLPLHQAVQYSSPELVKFMIEKGANINAICYNDFTALHLCKSPDTARVLIEAGADTTITDSQGNTALQLSALNGQTKVAEVMIEAGAKLDLLSATALGMSEEASKIARENPDLLRSADPHRHVLQRNETPLGIAASMGDLELVKLFVELGAEVNSFNFYPLGAGGYSPLTNAVEGGWEDVVEFLLQKGANPNVKVGKFGIDLTDAVREEGGGKILSLLERAKYKEGEQGGDKQPASAPKSK
ncbi:MAG: ankyrin repeat domain-containing protein [Verrucomicrobiae bacterium]|nr:ankyrin repeat domain-containing protein [Verrucomicrobiae bacterium]